MKRNREEMDNRRKKKAFPSPAMKNKKHKKVVLKTPSREGKKIAKEIPLEPFQEPAMDNPFHSLVREPFPVVKKTV